MSITQAELEKISSNLSKLDKKEWEKLLNDINNILQYVEELWEVDTKWVKHTISPLDIESRIREDIKDKKYTSKKDLLNCTNNKVIWDQIAVGNIM